MEKDIGYCLGGEGYLPPVSSGSRGVKEVEEETCDLVSRGGAGGRNMGHLRVWMAILAAAGDRDMEWSLRDHTPCKVFKSH